MTPRLLVKMAGRAVLWLRVAATDTAVVVLALLLAVALGHWYGS